MHLVHDVESSNLSLSMPPRRESAAARLLASGELGAHLLRLAEGAAAEHARLAQEAPDPHAQVRGREGAGA